MPADRLEIWVSGAETEITISASHRVFLWEEDWVICFPEGKSDGFMGGFDYFLSIDRGK